VKHIYKVSRMKLTLEKQEMLFLMVDKQLHWLCRSALRLVWLDKRGLHHPSFPSDPLPSYATTSMQERFIHEGSNCLNFLLPNFIGSTCDPYEEF
jgi:hypothetical protein